MAYNGLIRVVSEQRRYNRIAYENTVKYSYGPEFKGTATCQDVSLGGLRLRLGRYLRPGTFLMLKLDEAKAQEPVELKARISWCRGADSHHFVAGLRVFHDEPEAALALSRLTAWAALETESEPNLWSDPLPKVVLGRAYV